ncbi:glycosyltransferase family 4 protein [Candidatus Peregrinibacteria bacterium]|nr:glycosyltransferase family 4 protein [Candidatus Peregrinibacteria bacterium]
MNEFDKKGCEAFFMGSCPILLKEFRNAGFSARRAWLAKPPVTKVWLLLFTLMSPILFFLAGWYLWRARMKWKVNVLYSLSFGEKLLMTPWARLFGMKILWLEHARIGNWFYKNPWRRIYSMWSRWAKVVVTSNAMVKYLEPYVRNVTAISCPVIVDRVSSLPANLDKKDDKFLIGTVARLTVDKGVDKIVRLVHSKPDTRLVIVGEGPLLGDIKKLADEDRVTIIPSLPREQLMALYKSLDLFILGSMEMDPFGMVAAEAMYFGAPVLMTNVCGISEDLENGREAIIVDKKYSSMDKALKKLMRHDETRGEIAARGQAFVKKQYRLSEAIAKFEALI